MKRTPASPRSASPAPDGDDRKERVLHARIPEALDEAIREHAATLGVSVSNLVRNVLANAVEVVGAAAGRAARPAAGGRGAAVLGWHEAVLERNAVCDRCNRILPRGTGAAIAIVDGPAALAAVRPIRCLPCLEELRRDR